MRAAGRTGVEWGIVDTFDLLPTLAAGELEHASAPELVAAIFRSRASGTLSIEGEGGVEIRQFFRTGDMCGSAFFAGFRTLAQVLLANDWVAALDIDSSRAEAQAAGKQHGTVLVEKGLLTSEQLKQALYTQHCQNLAALLALDHGHYELRGWEPPPVWSRELSIDPVSVLVDALEANRMAARRRRVLDWLGGHAARLSVDWPEISARVQIDNADRRATALLALPRRLAEFVHASRLSPARAEGLLVTLLLTGAAEISPGSASSAGAGSRQPAAAPPSVPPPPAVPHYVPSTAPPEPVPEPFERAAISEPVLIAGGGSAGEAGAGELVPLEAEPEPPPRAAPPARSQPPPPASAHAPRPRSLSPGMPLFSRPPTMPPRPALTPGYRIAQEKPRSFPPAASSRPPPQTDPEQPAYREGPQFAAPPPAFAPPPVLPPAPEPAPFAPPEPYQERGSLPAPALLADHDAFAQIEALAIEEMGKSSQQAAADAAAELPGAGLDPNEVSHSGLRRLDGGGFEYDGRPGDQMQGVDFHANRQQTAPSIPPPDDASAALRKKMRARGMRNLGTTSNPAPEEPAYQEHTAPAPAVVDESLLTFEDRRFIDDIRVRTKLAGEQDAWVRLGVARSATSDQIRAAYLEAAKRYHPDRAGAPALAGVQQELRQVFTSMKEAYDAIATAPAREAYTAQLKTGTTGKAQGKKEEAALALKMGEVLLKKRDFSAALAKLRRSVDLDPNGDSLAALAWGLMCDPGTSPAGKEEAAALLNRALRAHGLSARTYYVAGVLWRTKDPDSAADAFRKALEFEPHHADASLELRLLEMRQGKKNSGGGVLSTLLFGKKR